MEKQLTAVFDDGLGKAEAHTGTREEIEALIENGLDPALISITVTDDRGLVVGRKLFGVSDIAWVCQ